MAGYVVYGSILDDEAAKIIAKAFGYALDLIPPEVADPLTQHTKDDIIAVGGSYPNVFYRYFFCGSLVDPTGLWDRVFNPTNYPDNPELWQIRKSWRFGVSPNGRWHIETITRENGTKVTGVAGVSKEDTLEAAKRFSKKNVNVAVVLPPLAVALVGSVAISRR
jgi:hypothetical protein